MSFRRPLLAFSLACAALASGAIDPSPADAQWTSQPMMLGDTDITVVRGADSWVNVAWTAPTEMLNFRMTVSEWQPGTEAGYAEGDSAALTQDSTLSPGEIDITPFQLTTDENTPDTFFLEVIAEWEHEGETFRYFPGGLNVRVVEPIGDGFQVLSADATVSSTGDGAGNWIDLEFLGHGELVSNVTVRIEGSIDAYYPQGDFTSLHHDAWLEPNERDVARFWIDPTTVDPGRNDVQLIVSWTDPSGAAQSAEHPFRIEVR